MIWNKLSQNKYIWQSMTEVHHINCFCCHHWLKERKKENMNEKRSDSQTRDRRHAVLRFLALQLFHIMSHFSSSLPPRRCFSVSLLVFRILASVHVEGSYKCNTIFQIWNLYALVVWKLIDVLDLKFYVVGSRLGLDT